jgi:two-component system, cell cycle sensor histidine kinase and response regulator CckA
MDKSKDYKDIILGEQVRLAIKQLPTLQIASFITALVLAFTVRNITSRTNIIAWLLMVLVIVFSRTFLYYRFLKLDAKHFDAEYWKKIYLFSALFSGIVWGLSAFLIFPVNNLWPMALFLIAIAGLSAGTAIAHAGIKLGSIAWVVPVMLLYTVRCVMEGREFEYILSVLIVTFMASIIVQSLKNNEAITSSLSFKFDNIELLTAVRESEERFRVLAGASFEGIVISQKGIIKDCNEQLSRMLGFSKEELIDKPIRDLLPPEEIKRVMDNISSGKEIIVDHDLLCKDGSRRSIEAHGKSTIYYGGEYRITAIHDITERKRAEEALKKSEHILQAIIDAEPECVELIDADANLIMMNRAGLSMIEVESLEQIKGQFVCPMIAPEHRAAFMDLTNRVFKGESGTLAFEMIGAKGRHLWLETHAVPFRNEKDEIVALLGITRDITERKHVEDTLRRNEEMVRNILNSVDEGFIVVDQDYRIQTANRAYCNQIGLPHDEVVGKICFKLPHKLGRPCYVEGEECAVRNAFNTGEASFVYNNLHDADGNILRVETKAFPLKDASGQVTSVIESITNITAKHLLEQERLKMQKLEAVGTLAGGIAHDFNNLLQGVFGYISLAKLTAYGRKKSLAALEQAEKALQMSIKLTNQLLTFSKGGKPVKKLIDLSLTIENAVQFALSGSRSDYRIVADDGLWQVEVDEGQISQVIQNIVLNAEQAMLEGGRVEITARNVHIAHNDPLQGLEKGRYVQISIKDSGIGIPEEYIAKIFDPYFTTKEKGSGLGLATSYSIIKNHSGLIEVKSEVGKGTTFFIYLPAFAAREITESLQPQTVVSPVRSLKVLIMDDDKVILDVAGKLIKVLGHDAEFSAHGEEAIEKYRIEKQSGKPFDLVILDLTIKGGMGGAETMEKLMEIDPGVKAIVSSGYSDDDIVSNHKQQGFKAFLKKPYSLEKLQEILNSVLNPQEDEV